MAPMQTFEKDEKVLCFHHELLYEAKVLGTRQSDPADKKSPWQYLIHYKGWKNTWDDWVPQDRLRKFSEDNQELARNLKKEMTRAAQEARPQKLATGTKRKPGASGRGSEERNSTPAAIASKKRGRDLDTEREETFHAKPVIRIPVPDILKSLLVDDWENVTKNQQVVSLPSTTPCSQIMDDYAEFEMKRRVEGTPEWDILEEIIKGFKEYFSLAVGRVLLYKQERPQFAKLYKRVHNPSDELAGKSMYEIYGAEHMIRLLVTMPELIAQTNMDQQSVARLREELSKLTMWLAMVPNVRKYFSVPYVNE